MKNRYISIGKAFFALIAGLSTVTCIPANPASAELVSKVDKVANQSSVYGLAYAEGKLFYTDQEGGNVRSILSAQEIAQKRLKAPKGLAVAPDQSIFVADSEQNQIYRITPEGRVDEYAGKGREGLQDGPSSKARFHGPSDVAIAPDGSIYVADTLNHRIRKIDGQTGEVSTVAGSGNVEDEDGWLLGGYRDGKGSEAQFNEPSSIAFDGQGNLYIADTGNQRIRKLALNGVVTTVAGSGKELVGGRYYKGGFQDGSAASARFNSPMGLTVSNDGTIYVADTWNNSIREISPEGWVRTVAGNATNGSKDSWGIEAQFDGPTDVAVTPDGVLFVADHWNRSIRQLTIVNIPVKQGSGIRMMIDQKPLHLKQQPTIIQNQTFVPLREIAEALGYKVIFDPQKISLQRGNEQLVISTKDTRLIGGKAMISMREIGKLIQVDVNWLPTYRMIELTTRGKEG
ncbi:stalk domain-containing protein [Brevibacillus sp. SYSU BS000544]|uniref:NHL domain-containing protein n=1 Tax=Brevibacillus sp. SYSU BS000544 TaxID=3416443 RepID=UPI003CE49165